MARGRPSRFDPKSCFRGMSRTFLPWDRPALPQAAAVLLDHYMSPGAMAPGASGDQPPDGPPVADRPEARMDGAVVVVPGARAGRRLKELLVEVADQRGVRLIPPRVVTMGVLPDLLHDPGRPVASGAVLRLTWIRALRETPPDLLQTVFARLPENDAPLDWAALARELSQLARDVAGVGYRFGQVATQCRRGVSFDDAERWEILAGVQDRMERLLKSEGLVDRDLARMDALSSSTVRTTADLWLVGVAEMPAVVGQMLRSAGSEVRALLHAPEERANDFDELGCVRVEVWSQEPLPLEEAWVTVCDRPQDQAVAVARMLADLDGERAAEEIALGVPLPEVVPFLELELERAGVAVRDASGTPLSATGPYRLLGAVAAFLDDRRYEELAALVRHPDLAPWLRLAGDGATEEGEERASAQRSLGHTDAWLKPLDEWHNRHLPVRMVAPYPGQESSRGKIVRALMERLDTGLLQPLSANRPLREWTQPIMRLLATVYEPHELRDGSLAERRVIRALGELRRAAEGFATVPEGLDVRCGASQAIRMILGEASAARIPPDVDEEAVEVLGWLELHLDDAPVTILAGVNEGALPESVRGDAFLPNSLRSHLGLEDNALRHARDVYRMAAMAHSREVLRLVVGRRTVDGDPLRPSRLLFQTDDATVVSRVRRFFGSATGPGPAAAAEPADAEPAPTETVRTSAFRLPPEPELAVDGLIDVLRVTDFRTILADPYGFALQRRYRVDTLDDHVREMDGALFGTVAHEVLEAFGLSEAVHDTDPRVVGEALDELLDAEARQRFGGAPRVAVRLQVEQLRARLGAFARWHVDWVGKGWRVVHVEASTPDGGIPFDVDDKPVGLTARIDRVDYNEALHRYALFDYKTSDKGVDPDKAHRRGSGENKEWVDLQLPLYHWLAGSLTDADGNALISAHGEHPATVDLGYILLPRDLQKTGNAMAGWDDAVVNDGIDRAKVAIRALRVGPARFAPEQVSPYADDALRALLGQGLLSSHEEEDDDE